MEDNLVLILSSLTCLKCRFIIGCTRCSVKRLIEAETGRWSLAEEGRTTQWWVRELQNTSPLATNKEHLFQSLPVEVADLVTSIMFIN